MGYQVYEDAAARDYGVTRWAGYGVPAECDHPDCSEEIDRGFAYKCEEHITYLALPDGGEDESVDQGCGLYFCSAHLDHETHGDDIQPKPDTAEWEAFMLTDESWERWRAENQERVAEMRERVA